MISTDSALDHVCGACGRPASSDALAPTATPSTSSPTRCDVCGRERLVDAETVDGKARVVVAHDNDIVGAQVATVLAAADFAPVCVKDGQALLLALDPVLPAQARAAVVDVGIIGVLVFEVIERVRREPLTSTLPIVLLASVHARTRYKRPARRLYGADAVLELPDDLERLPVIVSGLTRDRAVSRGQATRTSPAAQRLLSDLALTDVSALERGIKRGEPFAEQVAALNTARARYVDSGGVVDDFEAERAALSARLLARFGGRGLNDG
jgi:CheY-like chemotaxis protein